MPDWVSLRRGIDGEVALPGSPAFEATSPSFNARFGDVRPSAVVSCASAQDVAEAISFARRHGLGLATRAGGHSGEVYQALEDHDLTIPGGTCPPVGVAGLTLGGGLGVLGRKYGVISNHLVGAEVVVADGRVLACDDHHQPELFWALRGAGAGNFGVVTTLVFRPVPAP
jgi:FAD/FMN-containing dehydrogenase